MHRCPATWSCCPMAMLTHSGPTEPAEPVSIASLLPPSPWLEFPHIEYGGDGERTLVVCGYLLGDAVLFDPVLRALPSLFVVHPPAGPAADVGHRERRVRAGGIGHAGQPGDLDPSAAAGAAVHGGAAAVPASRARTSQLTGWLAALRDPVVGPALSLLHRDPAHDWTVGELARDVATSETVLSERFRHCSAGRPSATSPSGVSTSPRGCCVRPATASPRSPHAWATSLRRHSAERSSGHSAGRLPTGGPAPADGAPPGMRGAPGDGGAWVRGAWRAWRLA